MSKQRNIHQKHKMPKLNKQLVESLISDVKEFTDVGIELQSRLGDVGHLSWRYPNKLSQKVKVLETLEKHKGTAGEMYILLLELLYDRVHFVLQLIVDYLETYPGLEQLFSKAEKRKKTSTNFTSASSTIRRIWWHLKCLPESRKVTSKTDSVEFVEKVSKLTQANTSQLSCENCSLVGGCILELISKIENAFRDNELISEIVGENKAVKIDISNESQWAAVKRLTHSLTNDIQTLLNSLLHVAEQNEALKNKTNQYSLTIKKLQRETQVMKFELNELLAKKEDISENNLNLSKSMEQISHKMTYFYEQNTALKTQLSLTLEGKFALENTVSALRKGELVCQTDQGNTNTLCSQETDSLEDELKPLSEMDGSLEVEKQSKDFEIGEKSMVENCPDNSGLIDEQEDPTNVGILKPGDDPEKDMARQLQSNKEKIDILLQQNERLSKTLDRLRKYRKTHDLCE